MAKIRRGTTPKIKCELPFDVSELAEAIMTIRQHGTVCIEKSIQDADCDGYLLSYPLSQEDTLKLDHESPVEIQVRVKTTYGSALASSVEEVQVGRILKDGVI